MKESAHTFPSLCLLFAFSLALFVCETAFIAHCLSNGHGREKVIAFRFGALIGSGEDALFDALFDGINHKVHAQHYEEHHKNHPEADREEKD